ncbi:hypothetical protein MKW98_007646 [Papaver atlanticum]|uniref:Uncharacterized protein n=1 Tax=Papaver atlanticum TaxID=357466 RepID=A0AAD4S3Y5_9MAGN|nr:hypothetical protein MKW98_007646 [Papaver atlanticum]
MIEREFAKKIYMRKTEIVLSQGVATLDSYVPYGFDAGKSKRGNLLERVRWWYQRHIIFVEEASLLKESNSVIYSFSRFIIDPKYVGCVYK